MIRLATDLEAFAAEQSKVQKDAEEALLGSARHALRHVGEGTWFSALLDHAERVLRDRFRIESGRRTAPAVKMASLAFRRQATKALRHTKKPEPEQLEARARALAASLATSAVNAALVAAARAEGVKGLFKVWHSMEDKAVRASHARANGQKVPLGRLFEVGVSKLAEPGDMRAPIEEWINCRCILGLQTAEGDDALAAAAMAELSNNDPEGGDMTVKDDEFDDDGVVAPEEVPWWGVLAPEGVLSGDNRRFSEGALTWRNTPLPIAFQKVNDEGHDGSVVVSRADAIWRKNGLVYGMGFFVDTPETDEAISLVASQAMRGLSVDADDGVMEMRVKDGRTIEEALDDLESGTLGEQDVVTEFTQARICGATLCAIPAFQEAFIALGYPPLDVLPDAEVEDPAKEPELLDEEYSGDGILASGMTPASVIEDDLGTLVLTVDADTGEITEFKDYDTETRKKMAEAGTAMPDGSFPIADVEDLDNAIQSIGRAKDPAAAKAFIKKRAKALGAEGHIPEEWSNEALAAAAAAFVKTEDGPGWLTHPVDTDRLRDYWVRGPGAAKINWGVPGDFNRCRANLAKYVKPQHLSGYCANRHYDALGFWPGRPLAGDTIAAALTADTTLVAAPALHLVAGATMTRPPLEWFANPNLTGPSPLVVTEEGRVFGHLAAWGTCHIGISGVCTTPPRSQTDYAYFLTGSVLTADGEEVPVGHLTVGTGHADLKASGRVAAAHYDNTGTAVADVFAGEDDHGIWVAGYVRPWASEEQIAELRASALSGDWRRQHGSLELVAALACNVPGFPIPRTALAASGGHQDSLVAAGIVMRPIGTAQESIEDIVRRVLSEKDRVEAKAQLEALARKTGRDPASKMKALAAARER